MKILLVEDEILIQKSLKMLLEKRGSQVVAVTSGKEAIEQIFEHDFDRIICDLMLNDISGFDIIEESKNKYSPDQIKDLFMIITAYSSQQVLEKAEKYGCPVINKPFDNINDVIDQFLRDSSL